MHMKVMAEQFVVQSDKLTHTPTGSTFWLGEKASCVAKAGAFI
jgi:hypothetical protein